MSPYLRKCTWCVGCVAQCLCWCWRCHAVHVLPVPRGRFTTGNLQLFMWRSLGRDNGNIWTQHSQSTHPHWDTGPALLPRTSHSHFTLFSSIFHPSHISLLFSVKWSLCLNQDCLSSCVTPSKSATSSSAARVPQCRSIPALCPAARPCQCHVLLIKMACEHSELTRVLRAPQPTIRSTKRHYHYYMDPNETYISVFVATWNDKLRFSTKTPELRPAERSAQLQRQCLSSFWKCGKHFLHFISSLRFLISSSFKSL